MSLNFKACLKICAMSVQPLKHFLILILISSNHLQKPLNTIWTTKPRNQFKCLLRGNQRQSHVFSGSQIRLNEQFHILLHTWFTLQQTTKARQPLTCKLCAVPLWAAWLFLLFCPCQCGGKYFPLTRRHTHLYLKRGPSCWEVYLVCLPTSGRKS